MTSIATYAARGRYALWGGASVNMYLELTDDEGDYLNDALAIAGWGVATGALFVPEGFATLVGIGLTRFAQGAGWAARAAAAPVAAAVSTVIAPVAAGYVIGATVGTVIAEEIWGEEGAQVALGFYSVGLLPGTEAPDLTNYQYILKPTAPGGPVSLYDVGEAGVKGTLRALDWAWKKKPRLFRHRNPWMI